MKIYGVAIIKNGVKFDFPFKESLLSMLPLVEKIYINVGVNKDGTEDGTLAEVKKIPKTNILEINWDDHRSDNGFIFSEMTNIPIQKMREELDSTEQIENAWALYLQSDEVIHEDDLDLIREDIKKAHQSGYDAIRFRYIHFWGRHDRIAIGKRWYPQEIRAFKVKSNILSNGDAQGFKNFHKVYESDAHIWHYGHVRNEVAYKEKMARQRRYHYKGMRLLRKEITKKIKDALCPEKTIPFYGRHPKIYHERIISLGGHPQGPKIKALHLKGDTQALSDHLLKRINAETLSFGDEKYPNGAKVINLHNMKYQKSFSPLCREWTTDFKLIIELSRHGVGLKY